MVKTPTEESLISHVQFLRELLDKGILEYISWLDTRDMVSDGLTKGQVDREAIRTVMNGTWKVIQKTGSWRSTAAARRTKAEVTKRISERKVAQLGGFVRTEANADVPQDHRE